MCVTDTNVHRCSVSHPARESSRNHPVEPICVTFMYRHFGDVYMVSPCIFRIFRTVYHPRSLFYDRVATMHANASTRASIRTTGRKKIVNASPGTTVGERWWPSIVLRHPDPCPAVGSLRKVPRNNYEFQTFYENVADTTVSLCGILLIQTIIIARMKQHLQFINLINSKEKWLKIN
ncbi:hypothetical protein PUN28_013689 [Cardiocondyla obscurior]|uniref:Uncharacterized protein n=1 Tax=Cardiocondyla obscurior TaxID=286306 RepID=A0AAW2F5U1_9HYME